MRIIGRTSSQVCLDSDKVPEIDLDPYAIDTMDKWDEEKLRSVILSKHGNPRTTTDVRVPLLRLSHPFRLLSF